MTGGVGHITIPGAPPVEIHDLLPSTNGEALRRIATGRAQEGWIIARAQSGGRGRRGRTWISDKGNLFATRLVEPRMPIARAPELSFVASLAVFDAVSAHVPVESGPVACKWPNDILIKRKKVAGLLLESEGTMGWIAVGIGINVADAPEGVEFPATSLNANGATADVVAVFTSLAAAFEKWYGLWRRDGFVPVRDAWLSRAAGIGDTIKVRLETRELSGIFINIDEDGALLLRLGNGAVERIAAGDVFFA